MTPYVWYRVYSYPDGGFGRVSWRDRFLEGASGTYDDASDCCLMVPPSTWDCDNPY